MKEETTPRLLVDAANIHGGGGARLLTSVLDAPLPAAELTVLVDCRMQLPAHLAARSAIRRVRPRILDRLKAQWWIARHARAGDLVLSFGNLPPLFKPRCRTVVFLQNRYLAEPASLAGFSLRTRLRIAVERLWLGARAGGVVFVVQTDSMKAALAARRFARNAPIHVMPFLGEEGGTAPPRRVARRPGEVADFLYVASGEPHKNHRRLIEAWRLLADDGLYPRLRLTLDGDTWPELAAWIDGMTRRHRLAVDNLSHLPHADVQQLYRTADALIYPSRFESLGMPLIEAAHAGLPVLAPELDYVRDVVEPAETFDPDSAVSIARAVKRFIACPEHPRPFLKAGDFLGRIWNEFRA